MLKKNNEILKIYKKEGALQEGHFILSSGKHSSVYLQSAIVLSIPKYLNKIALEMVLNIRKMIDIDKVNLVVSPAMGGVIIGSKIGEILNKKSIFLERVNSKFTLRRGFKIKKNSKVLIVEDVITTGKSSMECAKLIKKATASLIGFATIIDRSTKKTLKIKKKIISHLRIDVPTFKANQLPKGLKLIPITKPGSRFI